jgi:hypothetical protein
VDSYKQNSSMIMHAASTAVMARMDRLGDFKVIPGDRPFHFPQESEDVRPMSRTVRFVQGGRYYRVPVAVYPEFAVIADWNSGLTPAENLSAFIPEKVAAAMDSLAAQTIVQLSK